MNNLLEMNLGEMHGLCIVLHDFSKSTGYINRIYIQVCCNISVYDFDMNFTFIEESVQNYA